MLLIPTVEVQGNNVVVTTRDDTGALLKKVYERSEMDVVAELAQASPDRIYIVDVDGAQHGKVMGLKRLKAMIQAIKDVDEDVEIQVGGGVRTLDLIEQYLDAGVDFVVTGTGALKQPGFLADACSNFGGQIIFSIDVQDGKVLVDGWEHSLKNDPLTIIEKAASNDLAAIIYTDVNRIGTFAGVDLAPVIEAANRTNVPFIVSGGVASLDDLKALCDVEFDGVNIEGVLLDRAIYEDQLTLEACCDFVDTYEG